MSSSNCSSAGFLVSQLYRANATTLQEGATLLARINSKAFTQACSPAFQSTIGAHFRHLLEHYLCFFSQLEGKVICYDNRERNERLEVEYSYSVDVLDQVIAKLLVLANFAGNGECQLADLQIEQTITSTVERELLFLQSHTMHHFALIAAMCRIQGIKVEPEFGVAIATRAHQAELDEQSMSQRGALCAP